MRHVQALFRNKCLMHLQERLRERRRCRGKKREGEGERERSGKVLLVLEYFYLYRQVMSLFKKIYTFMCIPLKGFVKKHIFKKCYFTLMCGGIHSFHLFNSRIQNGFALSAFLCYTLFILNKQFTSHHI